MKKCYSHNEEDYSFSDLDECAESAFNDNTELKVGDIITIYEGEAIKPSASEFLPQIGDLILEQASDEMGEYAESWEFSNEDDQSLQEALSKAVDEWAESTGNQPLFYRVTDVKQIRVRFINEDGECEIVEESK